MLQFSFIVLVLLLIVAQRAKATVLVPVWRAQPWWEPALQLAQEVCYLPRSAGVFQHGAADEPARRPHWTLCALRFIAGGVQLPPRRGRGGAASLAIIDSAPEPAVRLPRSC